MSVIFDYFAYFFLSAVLTSHTKYPDEFILLQKQTESERFFHHRLVSDNLWLLFG